MVAKKGLGLSLGRKIHKARIESEARGETFYQGPSRGDLMSFPPKELWNNWTELDSKSWPDRVEKHYSLVPTTCFNCESACGLLAYIDLETNTVRKFEGNPLHPGSRGRNCAKGPATLNQVQDPDRILYPLKRQGKRGEGKWVRVSWDEALDAIALRIRNAINQERTDEVVCHIGRPGEDGFTERVLASWGVDGHNSHTNVCSSGGRAGWHYWTGIDRPSADYANAKVIFLISAHLETGHYFNPHAQRIQEAKEKGAKLIVFDTRLSNTATHADYWLAPQPGSEAAINLSIANYIISNKLYHREFIRRWWNWSEYMLEVKGVADAKFEDFEEALVEQYAEFTFEYAAAESGVDVSTLAEIAALIASAKTQLASHTWRSASAGNLGGWQISRTLLLLNALLGAIATEGGTFPNAWNKFVPRPIHVPPHPAKWNELSWPVEYPLAMNELSFLLPHLLEDGRGKLDVYFTRVYNPVWTNPDGMAWVEALSDEKKVECFVALTPTWNESAYFADYILPMGHASERHDLMSYEQYNGQWVSFRQPVLRAKAALEGRVVTDSREHNPGEVWEENEFWIDLSWRIDPTGEMGIRKFYESPNDSSRKISVDEYYSYIFDNSIPGLPETAAKENIKPLEYMRRYGSFEISRNVGQIFEDQIPDSELTDSVVSSMDRVYSPSPKPVGKNIVPMGDPDPDAQGRRPVGVKVDQELLRGFPTPSGKLEFYSSTLAKWGWPEHALPGYIKSHVHPQSLASDEMVLISTFRLPVQIHTRSANSKWLDEIAHTNPLWIHPSDAKRLGIDNTDLVRVSTEIGYFVVKPWVTEGIKPGVVACSHHMGRWKLQDHGQRQLMRTVTLDHSGRNWHLNPKEPVKPYESEDPDTLRIWWGDVGVHQNLTFPVHPDPISGMHCWHQAVTITKAEAGDVHGEVFVDTQKSRDVYNKWIDMTRDARDVSPNGQRRPRWLMRPLKPVAKAFALPSPKGTTDALPSDMPKV